MVSWLIPPLFGFILAAFFSLEGCAPVPVSQSDVTSADGASGYSLASSLEAMRRGQIPSEGPLRNIYFDFDRYNLHMDAREALKANAEWLKSHPSVRAEIEGHCDERGTNEYNLALGAKRAQVAKDYLVTLGISPDRLSTISYGEEAPVCREQTEECWQENRNDRFAISAAPTS